MIPINLEKQKNIRDLGGTETIDGRRIRRNKLIRSGRLSELTSSDAAYLLGSCRLRTVIDLRSGKESEERPDPQWGIVEYSRLPMLSDDQLGFGTFQAPRVENKTMNVLDTLISLTSGPNYSPKQYLMDVYRKFITTKQAQSTTRRFFEILLSHRDGALLYHCNGGKDRTGIMTVFLLTSLRVAREIIVEDYMESNRIIMPWLEWKLQTVPEKYQTWHAQSVLKMMYLADEDCLQAAYDEMTRLGGTPEGYLKNVIGITDMTMDEIRNRLLL